jgi:hypothetical protein
MAEIIGDRQRTRIESKLLCTTPVDNPSSPNRAQAPENKHLWLRR